MCQDGTGCKGIAGIGGPVPSSASRTIEACTKGKDASLCVAKKDAPLRVYRSALHKGRVCVRVLCEHILAGLRRTKRLLKRSSHELTRLEEEEERRRRNGIVGRVGVDDFRVGGREKRREEKEGVGLSARGCSESIGGPDFTDTVYGLPAHANDILSLCYRASSATILAPRRLVWWW